MNFRACLSKWLVCAAATPLLLATSAAAQEAPREINFYTSVNEVFANQLAEAFEKDHPEYDVVVLRLVAGALAARVFNEASIGLNEADLVLTASTKLFTDNPEIFKGLSGIPAYDIWPDHIKTANSVNAYFQFLAIYYNTNNVTEEDSPRKWQDLIDPRWQGKSVMLDPSASQTYVSWAQIMRDTFGEEFLSKIAAQQPTIVGGVLDAGQLVASGGADVAYPGSANTAATLKSTGAPLGVNFPDDPTIGDTTSIGLTATSPNPVGAQAFFEWILSPTGGLPVACTPERSVGLPDVAGCWQLPADFTLPSFDIPPEVAEELTNLLLP